MSIPDFGKPDVIVVGAGNAAACAALAAREQGVNVIMLEAAPIDDCGGNSRYTGGLMRVVFNNVDELAQIIPELTEEEKKACFYQVTSGDPSGIGLGMRMLVENFSRSKYEEGTDIVVVTQVKPTPVRPPRIMPRPLPSTLPPVDKRQR